MATILHADLDAFYASVEQLLDPALRGRPVAVGGGVVLAASYEARAYGVHSAMPGWMAKRLCPDICFVGGHFREYQRLGDEVVGVFGDFTPFVERVSIDEAYLDVAGAIHLFGPPTEIADAIRRRVREEIGLPVSIGVARTKRLAKVASRVAKPDGLVVVEPEDERVFFERLPVGLIPGVGPVTQAKLADEGVQTIGELAAIGSSIVEDLLDDAAPRPHESRGATKSVGAQAALGRRTPDPQLLRETLGYLADRVAGRLRASGRAGRTVTTTVRFRDLHSVTRSLTLPRRLSSTLALTEIAIDLAESALADHPREWEITLLGVSISGLAREDSFQLELGDEREGARWQVDRSVDAVRDKYGRSAVGYATVEFSSDHRVPEEFRELAEH